MNKYPNYSSKKRDQFLHDFKDRGMMRWFGFYLSDHSLAIRKQKKQEHQILAQKHHLQMSFSEIAETISLALVHQSQVIIEKNDTEIKNGEMIDSAQIKGFIQGYSDDGLVVDEQEIPYQEIKYLTLYQGTKS
ncbi:DNA polymerase III subunit alpha [Xylocopilactobacillus apis]|uniref:DNA-directed RNA polymerase beta subunit n=1 Tax=Xylocopilactobacillus apis TaxID=2932183 RepID=A0AAU9CVQ6_9LACO|nr:DNA polymerase III subunit alpha [Xylocopilactobacillus apis]BDR56466.1 hypothetical protein KIMC2_10280 [Xylocopilactobacillus apis]